MNAALALAIGLLVGAGIAWLVRGSAVTRERDRALVATGALAAMRADNEALREQRDQQRSLDDLLQPVRESLDNLSKVTASASRDRAMAEATLTTQIAAVQDRYQSLEVATRQVAAALARGQTRGQWGEMQLEGLLAHAGMLEGAHYRRQDTRAGDESGARPDVVVLLPGGGEVFVDAKFPFDAYWAAVGTDDASVRDAQLRKHAVDVLARAKELAGKRYSDAASSADFVVMFLPLESLLSAALEVDGLLLEKTFDKRVILATPTTMLALLRTIGFGYQRALMAQNAEEITSAAAQMLSRLAVLVEHVESMRRGLDQAVKGYNKFVGSFDSQALVQARRIRDLGIDVQRDLDSPAMIQTALRESGAPALRG